MLLSVIMDSNEQGESIVDPHIYRDEDSSENPALTGGNVGAFLKFESKL